MKKNQDYKNAALAALKGNWSSAVLLMLVYGAIALVGFSPSVFSEIKLALNPSASGFFITHGGTGTALVYLLELLLIYPLLKGLYNAFNRLLVNGDADLVRGMFKSAFTKYWRTVLATLLQFIYILLWSLLLIVPGIIKAFSYAMTWFILEDEPDLSPNKAIELSMAMMKGRKFDFFYLALSFIGWGILSVFTLGIGALWLGPYMYASFAAFYQDVKADFIAKKNLAAAPAAPAAPAEPVAAEPAAAEPAAAPAEPAASETASAPAEPAETSVREPETQAPAIKDVKIENPEDYMPK
ncbi:MAG: DUF975 family protein [Candidatus Cryptobacteroides sp.]